jgi:hypothetical protein
MIHYLLNLFEVEIRNCNHFEERPNGSNNFKRVRSDTEDPEVARAVVNNYLLVAFSAPTFQWIFDILFLENNEVPV